MNAQDGRVRMITHSDGVPLALGVAASCAAPGISAPISIQHQLYIDGGARPDTNADLLAGLDLARAIIVSPVPRTAKLTKACIAYCKRRCAAFTRLESTPSRFCPRRSRTMLSEQISSTPQRFLLRLKQVDVEVRTRRAASAN